MQSLNKHRPFKATGDDFSNSNPIFAFYFYKYYLDAAVNIYKDLKDPTEQAQLGIQLKETQGKMATMQNKSVGGLDEKKNLKDILQYTQVMFAKNDHAYREGVRSKQIAEDFLTLNRLYEINAKFGYIDQQQNKRKVYSKKKFIQIMKQLKNKPQTEEVPLPPPPPKIQQQIKQSVFREVSLPKPSKLISFNKIQIQIEANKALENAVSQLSFDRFKFARQQALRALDLLDQLCE